MRSTQQSPILESGPRRTLGQVLSDDAGTMERQAGEEVAALRRELESERRRADELEAALGRTTSLLQEADHRMKNSLQVISSLMLLKARRIGDDAAKRALQNMAERVSAIATVHRLLQSVGQESRFDLATFAAELAADSRSAVAPGQIDVSVDFEPLTVAVSKAPAVALVLNELVTNAVRHGFPEGRKGRIRVEGKRHDGEIRLTVADDGVGIEGEPLTGAFGRPLTEMLVRQLRGRVIWEDAAPGTRVVVDIPVPAAESHP
jgi:two-component sensor histidine kinase